jgi:hypothetical protein
MTLYYNKNNEFVKNGIIGELIAKFYIEFEKEEAFINFNHNDEYDLKSNKSTYEIKTDFNYIKYSSLFIEFESNEKPSGIKTSKSDYYIFVCPNNKQFDLNYIYEIKTTKLKQLIEKYKLLEKIAPCKDYYNNTYSNNKGYIMPLIYLLKHVKPHIINLNDFENLKNIIKENI